jgi:CheY-like chemotaxis protein/HPt (histidine-containing phosphotransfer) domain-containing protein
MVAFEAADSSTALMMMRDAARLNRPFDLALLDLMMPEEDGFSLARRIKNDVIIADTHLILMPSYGMRGHGLAAQQAGISGYLVKPVRQSDLFECIGNVMGEPANSPVISQPKPTAENTDQFQNSSNDLVTKHKLVELRNKVDEQILVAEDNVVNQKVVKLQLERLGYHVEVVENGCEALAALDRQAYSLVLMDCQMPKMDGYAATAEIRRRELKLGMQRLPIIAVTAHAMQGEREKCLAAGMDDYLAKPFKQNELEVIIKNWLTAKSDSSANDFLSADDNYSSLPQTSQTETSTTAADVTARLKEFQLEVGEQVANSIVELFLEDSLARLDLLQKAVERKDFADLKREAHGLKGSSGNVGAKRLADLCAELEIKAHTEDLIEVIVLLAKIEAEMITLHNILTRALKEILI